MSKVNGTRDNILLKDPRQSIGGESTIAQDNICTLRERPALFRCGHSIFYTAIPVENLLLISLLAFRLPCTIRDSDVESLMRCHGFCVINYMRCGAIRGDAMRCDTMQCTSMIWCCFMLVAFFPDLLTSFLFC